jgi:hypothetical protein
VAEPAEPAGATDQAAEISRLKDEIERLKGMLPDQSHVMKDVAYHFLESLVRQDLVRSILGIGDLDHR